MQYRREIDGLRAVAVIPVILFHAGIDFFGGGFVGVDVFFVISGFLISSIIIAEHESGTFSIVDFYERRARRILPALFCVILFSLPFAWFLLPPQDLKDFSQSLVGVSLFSSNFLFWLESGYFDAAAEFKPLLHTWSLAVEEQFYVLFPLLVIAVWRLRKRWILAVVLALGTVSLIASQRGAYANPAATFFLLHTRAWELIIGVAVAMLTRYGQGAHRISGWSSGVRNGLGTFGLLLIGAAVVLYDETVPFPSIYALVPTAGAALVILCASTDTWVGKALGGKFVVGIGVISYSAYLWHQPVFSFARYYAVGELTTPVLLLLVGMVIVLSAFSWKYVEQPFRDRHSFNRSSVFAISALGTLCLFSIGVAGHITKGFYDQRMTEHQGLLLSTASPSPKRKECHTEGEHYLRPSEACRYLGARIDWAVFGDSHSVELAYALARKLEGSNMGVLHLTFSGCPPMFGRNNGGSPCARWSNEAVEYVRSDSEIENVVVSYRINESLFGGHEAVYPRWPDAIEETERNNRWRSLVETLNALRDKRNVILVLQAPELRSSVQTLILRSFVEDEDIVSVERRWWDVRSAFVRERLSDLPGNVVVVDPAQLFCDNAFCYATKEGKALYFDDDHMSVPGARYVVDAMFDRLSGG